MRPAVVVLGAIGTIEIATIRDVKTALQGFAVEETLTRFQNVIARKFTAGVFKKLHAAWIRPSV
jgi:ribosome-associated toxin RatA of RatAB toxin-antitoxin module